LINPSEIVDALVELLRDIPDLVALMGGDDERIYAYHDLYPKNVSIDAAKALALSPSVMVAWTGSNPGTYGPGEAWKHSISITLRAQCEDEFEAKAAYYSLFRQITKGEPSSLDGVPLAYATVHTSCNPMDTPTINRQVDAAGIDYFEVSTSFTEIGDD
jgi:hypothetical protein